MKRKIKYKDKDAVGIVVSFDVIADNWSEFQLVDGTTIKMRPIVKSIIRVEGEHDPNGDPVYVVMADNLVMATTIPDHLRKEDTIVK